MFKVSQKKLEHTESSFENNVINIKLKDGVLDTDKQTISSRKLQQSMDFIHWG